MSYNPEKLEFVRPLLSLGVFILILAILFYFFSNLDQRRKDRVYQTYAKETNIYIAKNKEGLKTIFNDIFTDKICMEGLTQSICAQPNVETIPRLISQDLKDWSSIILIKYINGGL